jgi:prepilin-type N-terminal cleavage/methylation domain-containing protein
MKKLLSYNLRGNTIIEVLIAMAILTFCSTLAVVIYLNIQKSSLPFFKIKAVELAEFYMRQSQDKKEFSDQTFTAEEFTVKRSVGTAGTFPDCYLLRILVFDGTKKKIHELSQVIYKGNERTF